MCNDFLRLNYSNIIVDPGVRLAYSTEAAELPFEAHVVKAPVTSWAEVVASPIDQAMAVKQPLQQCAPAFLPLLVLYALTASSKLGCLRWPALDAAVYLQEHVSPQRPCAYGAPFVHAYRPSHIPTGAHTSCEIIPVH